MELLKPYQIEGRTQLTKARQKAQLERKIIEQDGRCYYCGGVMNRIPGDMRCATRDHLKPQPMGCAKDDRDENIVASCWADNYKKGSKR